MFKLSSTCLRAMSRKSVKSTYFFHIPWWESLLKTCLYFHSVQTLIRLKERPVWRLFIIISYCRGFCGELYQDKCIICIHFLKAYLCLFSIRVIEQENTANMFIWFEIGLNHICSCFISFTIAFEHLSLPKYPESVNVDLTWLKKSQPVVIISFFTIMFLVKMSPVSNRDPVIVLCASLSLSLSLRMQLNCGNPKLRNIWICS